MTVYLLDKSLKVAVYYEALDSEFTDNICVSFLECCPEDERIFLFGETNIYLTPQQARELAQLLIDASNASQG